MFYIPDPIFTYPLSGVCMFFLYSYELVLVVTVFCSVFKFQSFSTIHIRITFVDRFFTVQFNLFVLLFLRVPFVLFEYNFLRHHTVIRISAASYQPTGAVGNSYNFGTVFLFLRYRSLLFYLGLDMHYRISYSNSFQCYNSSPFLII